MQEIRKAKQKSSAQCSDRNAYRCRVCDGPVERPRLVCRECWYRELEADRWESYLESLDDDDTAAENQGSLAKDDCYGKTSRESPKLIVLCGPSHAGKTAFAKSLGGNFTVISPEQILKRLSVNLGDPKHETKVWDIHESMKRKALEKDRNVILDACHISKRARWHSVQGPNSHRRKICIVFDLPLQTIRQRCLKEKRMSLEEVERMWKDFQDNKPTVRELKQLGFERVYFVKE